MNARCKMRLVEITQNSWNPRARNLKFECVYDQDISEDRRFQEATPSGHLQVYVTNPAVLESLELGASYYLDLVSIQPAIAPGVPAQQS